MIDLQATYGKRYKVTIDETWNVEQQRKEEDKPWYYEIRGKTGYIYPHDNYRVALELTPRLWKRWEQNPPMAYVKYRECDEGPTLLITNSLIPQALKWIRPRRRRTLSPEHKAKLLQSSQKHRFPSKNNGAGDVSKAVIQPITPKTEDSPSQAFDSTPTKPKGDTQTP